MSEQATPAAAPSAPTSSPTPSSTPSSSSAKTSTSTPSAPKPLTTSEWLRRGQFDQQRAEDVSSDDSSDSNSLADIDLSSSDVAPDDSAELSPVEQAELQETQSNFPEEYQWLDSYKEGVHGVQLQELLSALQSGMIPEALFDKLRVQMSDGELTWDGSINDLRNSGMMRSKFTKAQQAQAERERQWSAERDEFVSYVKDWKENPELFLAAAEKLGLPVDKATRIYAERLQKIDQLWQLEQQGQVAAGTTQQLWNQQQQERELTELKHQQAKRAAQEQAQQVDTQADQAASVISQAADKALRGIGLDPQDKNTWAIVTRNIREAYARTGQMPTRQDILDAAQATKEERDYYISQHQARQPKPAAAVPRNLDAGAPDMSTARPRGGAPKAVTTKEWYRKNMNSFGKSR